MPGIRIGDPQSEKTGALPLEPDGLEYHNISTLCYNFKLFARLIDIAYVIIFGISHRCSSTHACVYLPANSYYAMSRSYLNYYCLCIH